MSYRVNYLIPILLLSLANGAAAEESCCSSEFGYRPIPMPQGQENDKSWMINNALNDAFRPLSELRDCPREAAPVGPIKVGIDDSWLDGMGKSHGIQADHIQWGFRVKLYRTSPEYTFAGSLTATNAAGVEDGDLRAIFTLNMDFIDNCPDPERSGDVLQSGQARWYGYIHEGYDEIEALGETFTPDDLIYDWERVPENCEIRPEKEPVRVGETITIELEDIVDVKGRPSQPWQHVLVKAEEGEIRGGVAWNEYKRFRVGKKGSVTIQYKAPVECPDQKKDTIIVENSCKSCEALWAIDPDHEIARREIEIECGGRLEYIYYQVCAHLQMGYYVETWETGQIPFFIEGNEIDNPGPATVTLEESGSTYWGDAEIRGFGSEEVTISGNLVPKEEGGPELHMTLEFVMHARSLKTVTYYPPWTGMGPTVNRNPVKTISVTREVKMPYEDGYKIEREPYEAGNCSATTTFILHLDE